MLPMSLGPTAQVNDILYLNNKTTHLQHSLEGRGRRRRMMGCRTLVHEDTMITGDIMSVINMQVCNTGEVVWTLVPL